MSAAAASSSPSAAAAPAAQLAPNHTLLYLANLPFTLTQEQLTAFVQKEAGAKVTGVTIVMRKGKDGPRSRGIGFAQVPNEKLDAVLALSGKDLDGRPFDAQVAKVQTPGGGEREPRPPKAAKAPVAAQQPRAPREPNADGSVPAPRKRNRNRKSAAAREAAAAAGADGSAPAASSSSAPRAPKASKRQSTIPDANHTLLYVNNLSFDASSDDVSGLFAGALGGVAPTAVELVLSKYGRFKDRSRGFAFVTVANDQVQKALALNGTTFQEREIGVQIAKEKGAASEQQA